MKYCTGCHNPEDREGDLSLATFSDVAQGLESGPLVLPGQPESSRLIRVLTGAAEPQMPPEDEDNKAPTEQEIAVLRAWIESGARGPEGDESLRRLITPKLEPRYPDPTPTITAVAISPDDQQLVLAQDEALMLPGKQFLGLPVGEQALLD